MLFENLKSDFNSSLTITITSLRNENDRAFFLKEVLLFMIFFWNLDVICIYTLKKNVVRIIRSWEDWAYKKNQMIVNILWLFVVDCKKKRQIDNHKTNVKS